MKPLVVEDDPAVRLILKRFLEPFGDCGEATNGPLAVREFESALRANRPYDLVCLDIQFPAWFGLKVIRDIRALETQFEMTRHDCRRVVMVTGNSDSTIVESSKSLSDAYLIKPRDLGVLRERLTLLGLILEPETLLGRILKACEGDQFSSEQLEDLWLGVLASKARLTARQE